MISTASAANGDFVSAPPGWQVHDLDNDVPAEQFVNKAIEVGAFVMGASAMTQTTALNIRKLRDLVDSQGLRDRLKLVVGGAVFRSCGRISWRKSGRTARPLTPSKRHDDLVRPVSRPRREER